MASENQNKIVRIMEEGQYEVSSDVIQEIKNIDDTIVTLVEEIQKYSDDDDSQDIKDIYNKISEMNSVVKTKGHKVSSSEIKESDIIIPNQDASLKDLKKIFTGTGLL